MNAWILTKEHNDYYQHGQYFVAAFKDKPTHQQLTAEGVGRTSLRHVLNGGGRVNVEQEWWFLKLEDLK